MIVGSGEDSATEPTMLPVIGMVHLAAEIAHSELLDALGKSRSLTQLPLN